MNILMGVSLWWSSKNHLQVDYLALKPQLFPTSFRVLVVALLAILVAGCSSVPTNHIAVDGGKLGKWVIDTPKNVAISDFKVQINTNGVFTLEFKRWSSTNDPVVIDKAAAGDVAKINAMSDLVGQAVKAGVTAAK